MINSSIEVKSNFEKNYKSILKAGNINIYSNKKFNWLNKIMFKFFFGIKIEDINSNNEKE